MKKVDTIKNKTPRQRGFRMPAEWEEQEAIWLSWPHNEITWPGKLLKEVENSYVEFVKALHAGQFIKLLVKDKSMKDKAKKMLSNAGVNISKVIFYRIPTVDAWIRDYGPTFLLSKDKKSKMMVKWEFNAWGGKYQDLMEDTKIPFEMNKHLKLEMLKAGFILEGGSIEVNGAGTLLTTEQCLLNKNRNPGLRKEEIEKMLKENLDVSNILWLKEGIVGDDTDGHIDDLARFVNKDTVVCAYEDDKADDNYEILKENYEALCRMKTEDGKPLKIMKLPMPGYVGDEEGRLPASYANFYIGNESVAVPVFGSANDKKALSVLEKSFPKHRVVGINCRAFVYGLGTLHCASQQEPKGLSFVK